MMIVNEINFRGDTASHPIVPTPSVSMEQSKRHSLRLRTQVVIAIYLFIAGGSDPAVHAEFALNFQPATSPINVLISCMPGVSYNSSSCVRQGSFSDPDTTPFFMETAADPSSGYYFYHVLIGDPDSDFSQEYYINQYGGANWYNSAYPRNPSIGSYNGGSDAAHNGSVTYYDPLDSDPLHSGNATGNPTNTIFRQTITGMNFNQVIEKTLYLKQPKITQQFSDAELTSNFSIDMSANSYTVMSAIPGIINNTVIVTDSQTGFIVTDFDIQTDSQQSYVTGGRFTYTNGTGVGGSNGIYTYATGGFDAHNIDWKALSDTTVNVPNY